MSLINRMLKDLDERRGDPGDIVARARAAMPASGDGTVSRRTRAIGGLVLLLLVAAVYIVIRQLWLIDPNPAQPDASAVAPIEVTNQAESESPAPDAGMLPPQPAESGPDVKPPEVTTAAAAAIAPVMPVDTGSSAGATQPAASIPARAAVTSTDEEAGPESESESEPDRLSLRMSDFLRSTMPVARAPKPAPRRAAPRPEAESATMTKRRSGTDAVAAAQREFAAAMGALSEGRYADAEDGLIKSLAAAPANHAARETLIALHIEQGRIESAQNVVSEGLTIDAAHTAYHVLGARAALDAGDVDGAMRRVDSAPASVADDVGFLALKGAVLQRAKDFDQAQATYRRLLEIDPANAQGLVGFAVSSENIGDRAVAIEAYRRALTVRSLDPRLARHASSRLRALESEAR